MIEEFQEQGVPSFDAGAKNITPEQEEKEEFIDVMEFSGEQEVIRNEDEMEKFARNFSQKQIGSICRYVEPVSGNATIDTLTEMFEETSPIALLSGVSI